MEGLLLVNKPVGWTSFDVVNRIRRVVAEAENVKPKTIKVGHSGTLDPFASGLLIILIGKRYTRQAQKFSGLDKTYALTMRLGAVSSTGDPEGELTAVSTKIPSPESIKQAVSKYIGQIKQRPPAYSAVKINGQRAYKLARSGQEVITPTRTVTIHSLKIVDYAYPDIKMIADVSSGTYIRSLVEDIGRELGVGAYTTELVRTSIANMKLDNAHEVEDLNPASIEQLINESPKPGVN
jgi:tRNA pseudouridine55 synthase